MTDKYDKQESIEVLNATKSIIVAGKIMSINEINAVLDWYQNNVHDKGEEAGEDKYTQYFDEIRNVNLKYIEFAEAFRDTYKKTDPTNYDAHMAKKINEFGELLIESYAPLKRGQKILEENMDTLGKMFDDYNENDENNTATPEKKETH